MTLARLDDLVTRVAEPALRRELEAALAETKRRQRFGLVYEEHVPETSALAGLPVQTGSLVQRRDDPASGTLYRVNGVSVGGDATVEPTGGGETTMIPVGDLLVVKRFGDPIYPSLTPVRFRVGRELAAILGHGPRGAAVGAGEACLPREPRQAAVQSVGGRAFLATPSVYPTPTHGRSLLPNSPECVEGKFCELRLYWVLRS